MTIRTLSGLLEDLRASLDGERTSVHSLLEGLHERGFGVVIMIFSLPLCIPVPKPPGISTVFGIPLLLLTLQQAVGQHTVWMPEWVRRRHIKTQNLISVLNYAIPVSKRLETLLRPRLEWVTQDSASRMTGLLGALMSAFISIPLPGSNTIPGIAVTLMAAGVMMRDGACVLLGAVGGTVWVVGLSYLYIFLGMEGLNALISLFKIPA